MGVNHISMFFRHHNIEPMANDISKLNFRIWANDCLLAGLCVKTIDMVPFLSQYLTISFKINFQF